MRADVPRRPLPNDAKQRRYGREQTANWFGTMRAKGKAMAEESFAQRTARAAYEEGRANGRAEERAAVVLWMRTHDVVASDGGAWVANTIESGDHLPPTGRHESGKGVSPEDGSGDHGALKTKRASIEVRAYEATLERGAIEERARIAAKMRAEYPLNKHAREWADWIEALVPEE